MTTGLVKANAMSSWNHEVAKQNSVVKIFCAIKFLIHDSQFVSYVGDELLYYPSVIIFEQRLTGTEYFALLKGADLLVRNLHFRMSKLS